MIDDDIATIGRIDAVPSILDVVCRTTGMGFAAIARVTEDRWIACGVNDTIDFGLKPGGELKLETTICNEIRASHQAVVIDHVAEDCLFRDHATPALYGFQSYISMPILRRDGSFFGTLCAIDPRPARVNTPEIIGMFKLFADLIGFHIEAQEKLASSEAALLDARQSAELREQFIAVLGHDLRNPLASIGAGANLPAKAELTPKAVSIVSLIQASVGRMAGLIDNVLDLARGRLGGGLSLTRDAEAPLEPVLEQVVAELRSASPDRMIIAEIGPLGAVDCDRRRIAQLLSNLLGNAVMHGAADQPVRVEAVRQGRLLTIAVENGGVPIAAEKFEKLFEPFVRGSGRAEGLGLGLYIASEIARAHGGELAASSTPEATRFVFTMPVAQ